MALSTAGWHTGWQSPDRQPCSLLSKGSTSFGIRFADEGHDMGLPRVDPGPARTRPRGAGLCGRPDWVTVGCGVVDPTDVIEVRTLSHALVNTGPTSKQPVCRAAMIFHWGIMSSLIMLAYTTAGGVVGSVATTAFSQGKDRRAIRAELRKSLHGIFRAGAMTKDMRADLGGFQEKMDDLESRALEAGAPYALVALHQEIRREQYNIDSFAQIIEEGGSFPPVWWQLASERSQLLSAIEGELEAFMWHPWRTRMTLRRTLGRLRQAQMSIDEQNANNWIAFEEHRRHCIELEIVRSNNRRACTGEADSESRQEARR